MHDSYVWIWPSWKTLKSRSDFSCVIRPASMRAVGPVSTPPLGCGVWMLVSYVT